MWKRRLENRRGGIEEAAHQRQAATFLQADQIFGDQKIGIADDDRARLRVVAQLAFKHDADAEAGDHRFAHGFACLHLDQPSRPYPVIGEMGLEHLTRDRAAFADHQVMLRQLGDRGAGAARPGMLCRHEQHQPVLAQRLAEDPRVGGLARGHPHVGLEIQHPVDHLRRVADPQA